MPYILEYAKSGRATCQGDCKDLIEDGALRFGSYSGPERKFVKWRHFNSQCMTDRVASNALDFVNNKLEDIEGFSELTRADQQRVTRYFKQFFQEEEQQLKNTKNKNPPEPGAYVLSFKESEEDARNLSDAFYYLCKIPAPPGTTVVQTIAEEDNANLDFVVQRLYTFGVSKLVTDFDHVPLEFDNRVYLYVVRGKNLGRDRYYVGITCFLEKRIRQHETSHKEWLASLTNLKLDCYYLVPDHLAASLENRLTFVYMFLYGSENVRGGSFPLAEIHLEVKKNLLFQARCELGIDKADFQIEKDTFGFILKPGAVKNKLLKERLLFSPACPNGHLRVNNHRNFCPICRNVKVDEEDEEEDAEDEEVEMLARGLRKMNVDRQ